MHQGPLSRTAGKRAPEGATNHARAVKFGVATTPKRAAVAGAALEVRAARAMSLAVALMGCFSPDLSGAECLKCPDNVCPGDMACRAGYCVDPGSATQCLMVAVAPAGGGAAGDGAGGEGSAGADGIHKMGLVTLGGAAGESGNDGGAPVIKPPVIKASPPKFVCTGANVSVDLSVVGGTGPFTWQLVGGAANLTLDPNNASATLTGVFSAQGDYPVTVAVTTSNGSPDATFTLHVRETPTVVAPGPLPAVCPNEKVSVPLNAEGGDASSYRWFSNIGDIPAGTGLSVVGDELIGVFKNTTNGAASEDFSVWVSSDGCESDHVPLTLDELAPSNESCPSIRVDNNDTLPSPCTGAPYSVQLALVSGSASDYTWSASLPAGLSFDPNTQIISGTGESGGPVTVTLTGSSHTVETDFVLGLRDHCWLAYLEPDDADIARLWLFDPLLGNRHSFPSTTGTDSVSDFAFSPDGNFLAYRTGTSSSGQVSVVEMATLNEELLSFDTVTHYLWSEDSTALAVAFTTSDGSFVGGIDASQAQSNSNSVHFPVLTAGAASVDSAPVWFDSTTLAFLSSTTLPNWPLALTPRDDAGFSDATLLVENVFDPATVFRTTPAGLYATPSNGFHIAFYPVDGSPPIPQDDVLVGGTGHYVVRASGGALVAFRSTDSALSTSSPYQTADGCDKLLAWASQQDRIACSYQANQITIFDIASKTDNVSMTATVTGTDDDSYANLTGRQRIFSPAGDHFAFTGDTVLNVANATTGDIERAYSLSYSGDDVALAFSPDGTLLLEHVATSLSVFKLADDSEQEVHVGADVASPNQCLDSLRAAAGTYCGDASTHAPFLWSPDSSMVLYRTVEGGLEVAFVSPPNLTPPPITVTDSCLADCNSGDQFAFQPPSTTSN
jgi:Putative Ig domain